MLLQFGRPCNLATLLLRLPVARPGFRQTDASYQTNGFYWLGFPFYFLSSFGCRDPPRTFAGEPTIGVQDVYIYFYDLDPPRRPAGETKNLTQPGGQVRT